MFDLLILDAAIVDGTGRNAYVADLAVKDGKIAAIGRLAGAPAARTVKAGHHVLCPGFIDLHCHTDLAIYREDHEKLVEPLLRQGITTFVGGNCGMGLAPLPEQNRDFNYAYYEGFTARDLRPEIKWSSLGEFMDYLETQGVAMNTALLAPHGILRIAAVGPETRHATPSEVALMARWLEQALDEGAIGLSTGLQYFPGSQSETSELIDLARVVARQRGVFTSHLRSYSATLPQAINEVATVGREADVPVQISHLFWIPDVNPVVNKLTNYAAQLGSKIYERVKIPVPLDGAAAQILAGIDQMRRDGLRIGVDAMPTSAGFTHLIAFFPPWVIKGKNMGEILDKLRDPKIRKKIRRDIDQGDTKAWPHDKNDTWSMNFFKIMGWGSVSVMSVTSAKNKELEGCNMVEIGRRWKMHPFDAACELLLQENGKVLVFETLTHPGDDFVERSLFASMADPNVSIVTDAIMMGFGRPSHLFYDCYPKFFQKYVRELGMIGLEAAVRKCTGLPADSMGLPKRGYLKRGYAADLVLFDLNKIRSNSTTEQPDVFPSGIDLVIVNGRIAVEGDTYHGGKRYGQMIRH